jgi:phenylpyruvate tautomerase PptA (4-oxalocrotonate tautomerase family)
VSITDETNTKAEKARYIAAVQAAMSELLGTVAEHSYVHVADLRASAYGYGGRTQEARYQQPGPQPLSSASRRFSARLPTASHCRRRLRC